MNKASKAGLWVQNLSAGEVYYRLARSSSWSAPLDIVQQRVLIDLTLFTNPVVYHEMVGFYNAATPTVDIRQDSVDSGTSGSVVAGANLALPAAMGWQRSVPITINTAAGGSKYYATVNPGGGEGLGTSALVVNFH